MRNSLFQIWLQWPTVIIADVAAILTTFWLLTLYWCNFLQGDSLPQWMSWLNEKLSSASTPVNVKHFIARLILNNEKVYHIIMSFQYDWPPLAKQFTSHDWYESGLLIWSEYLQKLNYRIARACFIFYLAWIMHPPLSPELAILHWSMNPLDTNIRGN